MAHEEEYHELASNYRVGTSTVHSILHEIQSYPGYPNTFGQRGFIGCSDKRNCSDNPNETFLAIYILYNIKSMYEGRA